LEARSASANLLLQFEELAPLRKPIVKFKAAAVLFDDEIQHSVAGASFTDIFERAEKHRLNALEIMKQLKGSIQKRIVDTLLEQATEGDRRRTLLLIFLCIAIVLAGAVAIMLKNFLNRRIDALVTGANTVAEGNLGHRLEIGVRDEFGQISTAINKMVASLESNIEQRKLAEQEAAEKSALLEATFENMAQGVAVYDSDHTLMAFNPQYAEISGLPSDYLHTGLNHRELIRFRAEQGHYVGTDAEADAAIGERRAAGMGPENGEHTLPDGRSFSYELTPTPDGGYIITLMDITARHEAEKQLHQARKMEAVGELTGGIAHDFNNLLAVSLGNVELAEEVAEAGGDVKTFLTAIKHATERGASLTSKLLAFSRKQTLFPQVVDAGELVSGMTGLLRSALAKSVEIRITGDDGLWSCKVDPGLLESAVLNLVINARDAIPGGGKLTIGTTNVSLDDDYAAAAAEVEPGEYVMIAVTDTGTGMPQEVIDHAFDPFFTTKEVGRGSGLGLSMVYGFVKQSGGHVTIYSEEGKGTTVKLYLPRSDRAEEHLGGPDQADIPQARGETVLVVEDDPDVRTLSVALLRSLGYEILETADGQTALKALESAPRVNLVFTDMVLPGGMSGPELAAEVESRFPGMAVLYTSGYTELANFHEGTLGEDTELLQKPYRKADLAWKVRRALDQARL
jgi:PAS domain S-box-containing protein